MNKIYGKILPFLLLILFSTLILTGCKQKTETPQEKAPVTGDTSSARTMSPSDSMKQEVKQGPISLTGKWTGIFDQRPASFNITDQNDTQFSGTLTISYRDPLTKAVSGKYDMQTMKFTMNDTEHGRFMGSYSGKISEDGKMQGTFTLNSDKSNYSFNFKKK